MKEQMRMLLRQRLSPRENKKTNYASHCLHDSVVLILLGVIVIIKNKCRACSIKLNNVSFLRRVLGVNQML